MNSGPDERAQPGSGRAPDEFDAIVAAWRREGPVPQWPDPAEQPTADLPAVPRGGPAGDRGPRTEPTPKVPPPGRAAPAGAGDDDHFVPPEPPPLPRLGPPALVGLSLLALGLVLVLVPGWVGVGVAYGLPLGLLTLAAGLGWLVLRLWPDPPQRSAENDDGAIL